MTSLEELIGKDGSVNLGEDFEIRPGFLDEDGQTYWYGQVFYRQVTPTTESPVGEARLAVMRYMNGTLAPDPKDQAFDLAEHLYRLVCEVEHQSSMESITLRALALNRAEWENTIYRVMVVIACVVTGFLIVLWRTS